MSAELAEAAEPEGAESPQQEEPRQLLEPSPLRGRAALDIAARFNAPGVPTAVEVHAGGHINKSYRVTFSQKAQGGIESGGEDMGLRWSCRCPARDRPPPHDPARSTALAPLQAFGCLSQ